MKKSFSNKSLELEESFNLALENQRKNNFTIAQNFYRKVLEINPNHSDAHNNMGLTYLNLGNINEAMSSYKKAIQINAKHPRAHHNLGVIFQELKEFKKAQSCYEKAIQIDPNFSNSHYNLGLLFQGLREFEKAKNCYESAIKVQPDYIKAHNNLGLILRELGDLKRAANCYKSAIKINSNFVDAHYNLGIIFREMGEFEESKKSYQRALQMRPNDINLHNNLGNVFKKLGEDDDAIKCFEKALQINPNSIDAQVNISNVYISQLSNLENAVEKSYKSLKMYKQGSNFISQKIPLYRLKHDVQQAEYLNSKNYKIDGITEFQKIGRQILEKEKNNKNNDDSDRKIFLNNDEIKSLLPFYKANYIYSINKILNGYINPLKNWKAVENEYFDSPKQIIYIDNFLSEEAIKELREFCLVSKIWIEERSNKYLGSFSDKGFISPLHLKIAIELKNKLPKLFGNHRLGRFWGFKYDSSLGKGINIHADFALVNLNFWITPDEYNNNKNAGGLKVYDTPAPDDWTFQKYNVNAQEIYKLLKRKGANCTNVPYKFNRAVLFNSDYFHETDNINFKDEYEGRRINITYLFGDRLFKKNNKI